MDVCYIDVTTSVCRTMAGHQSQLMDADLAKSHAGLDKSCGVSSHMFINERNRRGVVSVARRGRKPMILAKPESLAVVQKMRKKMVPYTQSKQKPLYPTSQHTLAMSTCD